MIMKTRAELINGSGEFGPALLGGCDGVIKISNAFRQVGAIDIEGNRHLSKGGRGIRYVGCKSCHPSHLGRQQDLDCHALAGLDVITDHALISGETADRGA